MQTDAVDHAVELTPVADVRPGSIRLRGVLIFIPCAVLVSLSAWLTPSKAGYGTHRGLGLPPCAFLSQTGYPCPSCGMTTAFADMAHGRFVAAFMAQPFGAVLFVAVMVLGLVGLGELLTGRGIIGYLRPGPWWAVATVAGLLLGWGIKIACGLAAGTLPVR